MSAQRVGPRKVRRLRRTLGLNVTIAHAWGGYAYLLTTGSLAGAHTHYWYDLKTGLAFGPTSYPYCVNTVCRARPEAL